VSIAVPAIADRATMTGHRPLADATVALDTPGSQAGTATDATAREPERARAPSAAVSSEPTDTPRLAVEPEAKPGPITDQSRPDAGAAKPPDPRAGEPTTRRPARARRFAMPVIEEDRRTEAAINAFLGEPSAPAGAQLARRTRRRSRRQRAPGETPPPPTVVVAAIAGWDDLRRLAGRDGAGRFGDALANAVRGTIRSGDELLEVGDGRLRIVVHADEEGARALIERATTMCDPWLRAAPVPLSLRARTVGPTPPPHAEPVAAGRATASVPVPAVGAVANGGAANGGTPGRGSPPASPNRHGPQNGAGRPKAVDVPTGGIAAASPSSGGVPPADGPGAIRA
jgi:hypothetical protein